MNDHIFVVSVQWMMFAAFGTPQSLFDGTQAGRFSAQSTGVSGGLFGTSTPGSGFPGTGGSGTGGSGSTVKFVPVSGTDVIMKGGCLQSVSTKLQCITGMKEYEANSLEVYMADAVFACSFCFKCSYRRDQMHSCCLVTVFSFSISYTLCPKKQDTKLMAML